MASDPLISNESLLPMYKTLVYALNLPISILIMVNNSFLVAVLYKKPKLCGISTAATINLSATAIAIGLVEFVFCLILSGDTWRYYSPTLAVTKYVLVAIPHLVFTLTLTFLCFQRYVYKCQNLKQINPRKTCLSILTFWFVAIILVAVPLAHYDSAKLSESSRDGQGGGRTLVFLYGQVLIALGLANTKITYVAVFALVSLLNAILILKMVVLDDMLKNKVASVPVDQQSGPITNPNQAVGSGLRQTEELANGGASDRINKNQRHQGTENDDKASDSATSTSPSQPGPETLQTMAAVTELRPNAAKISRAFAYVYLMYTTLCIPYMLIVVLILFGVRDRPGGPQPLSVCEILAYYAFLSGFALYPYLFVITIRPLRAYLWKLIC